MYEFSSVFKFMCVSVCVVQVHKYVSVHMCGGLKLTLAIFMYWSSPYSLGRVSYLRSELSFVSIMASQLVSKIPTLCLLSTGITIVLLSTLGIYVGTGM